MPALALPPPPSSAIVASTQMWTESASRGNGNEAVRLSELVSDVLAHWSGRAELLVAPWKGADDYSYVSIPANRMFYAKTRYVYAGKGMPRPFDLDEE